MNKILYAVAVLGLAACSGNAPPTTYEPLLTLSEEATNSETRVEAVRQAQLSTSSSCTSLDATVKAKLNTVMRNTLVQNYRNALSSYRNYSSWWGGTADSGVAGVGGGAGGGSGGSGGGATAAPMDVTTTNVQVAGVDEPDFIKNDGNRIFVLSKGKLFASRSWPAADLALRGSVAIPGSPSEMFLDGDQVIVFSTTWLHNDQATLVTRVDVSDLSNPKQTGQYELPGSYNSARRIGKTIRMVISRYFGWPTGVSPYLPYGTVAWKNEAEILARYSALLAQNEALINAATLEQLLPTAYWHGAEELAFNVDCGSVHLSNGSTALGSSEVVTFQTDVDGQLHREVLYEAANEVYASNDALYFASRYWWWSSTQRGTDTTYIHKFDTRDPRAATYVATGVIDGHLVDQFSMDEWNGNLRVAATVNQWSPTWGLWNEVSVLGQFGAQLLTVGKSAKLAQGERITSARFLGEVGYVVTFRQTDPLFVFDLKDPANPKKVGELKVPGFSSYIHPLDATHLLTIGTYQPEFGGWQDRAVQLAIFDVSDLTAPKQTHLQLLGSYTASSEAQREHKAFNYFPAKKLLAVPFYEWTSGRTGTGYSSYWYELKSELRVFDVDAVKGFASRGSMSMSDLGERTSYYSSDAIVRRSVMADDFVYAISAAGIRVSNINALNVPLATAKF